MYCIKSNAIFPFPCFFYQREWAFSPNRFCNFERRKVYYIVMREVLFLNFDTKTGFVSVIILSFLYIM